MQHTCTSSLPCEHARIYLTTSCSKTHDQMPMISHQFWSFPDRARLRHAGVYGYVTLAELGQALLEDWTRLPQIVIDSDHTTSYYLMFDQSWGHYPLLIKPSQTFIFNYTPVVFHAIGCLHPYNAPPTCSFDCHFIPSSSVIYTSIIIPWCLFVIL